jgi:hypothetical protein
VLTAQALGRLAGEKGTVRDEVAAGKLGLDDRPLALATGVAAGTDRAEVAAVRFGDEAKAVQQLAQQRHACDPGEVILGSLEDWVGDRTGRSGDHRVFNFE